MFIKITIKLTKYNVIYYVFNGYIENYLRQNNNNIHNLYIDSTHIDNQLGYELVDYNPRTRSVQQGMLLVTQNLTFINNLYTYNRKFYLFYIIGVFTFGLFNLKNYKLNKL